MNKISSPHNIIIKFPTKMDHADFVDVYVTHATQTTLTFGSTNLSPSNTTNFPLIIISMLEEIATNWI